MSPARREALVEPCRAWLVDSAVAHAQPAEIDALGIVGALRLAGARALARVGERGHAPGIVILDGSADWLSRPDEDLLTAFGPALAGPDAPREILSVCTQVGADARCAVVTATSVLGRCLVF